MTPTEKNYQRALYFLEKNIVVHIKKSNGSFFNGRLHEVNHDIIKINDRMQGMETIFLFDLAKPIVEFIEVEK